MLCARIFIESIDECSYFSWESFFFEIDIVEELFVYVNEVYISLIYRREGITKDILGDRMDFTDNLLPSIKRKKEVPIYTTTSLY